MRINRAGNPEDPKMEHTAGKRRKRNPARIKRTPDFHRRTARRLRKMKKIPAQPTITGTTTGTTERWSTKLPNWHKMQASRNNRMCLTYRHN